MQTVVVLCAVAVVALAQGPYDVAESAPAPGPYAPAPQAPQAPAPHVVLVPGGLTYGSHSKKNSCSSCRSKKLTGKCKKGSKCKKVKVSKTRSGHGDCKKTTLTCEKKRGYTVKMMNKGKHVLAKGDRKDVKTTVRCNKHGKWHAKSHKKRVTVKDVVCVYKKKSHSHGKAPRPIDH